jgi:hypothetical protein
MSLLVHWWQSWFEGYPAAPLTLMEAIRKILSDESPEILAHFDYLGY